MSIQWSLDVNRGCRSYATSTLLDAAIHSRMEERATRSETGIGEEEIKEEEKWKEEAINTEAR
jgi:hypothetical protein